jgi:hypothetical protein
MKLRMHTHRFLAAALLTCSFAVSAAPVQLAGLAPYTAALNGIESDGGVGAPWSQSFSTPAGATLDKIVWWGYRLNDASTGADADAFEVAINGALKAGSLAVDPIAELVGGQLLRYTFDVADEALASGNLTVINNGNFEWYWQGTSAAAFSPTAPFPVAYSLIGTLPPIGVPEPETFGLVSLAAVLAAVTRRRLK